MNPQFRALYGDELAEQIEKLKAKSAGTEVLRAKPARWQPSVPERAPSVPGAPDSPDPDVTWWNR
jgi:hypothetical protein